MDEQRRIQLQHSLERELADAQMRLGLDVLGCLGWLGDRTAEHLDRWLAFCDASDVPPAKGIDNVLFGAVEIAASVTSFEVQRTHLYRAKLRSWEECVTALRAVRLEPSDRAVESFRLRLNEWRGCLRELTGREAH